MPPTPIRFLLLHGLLCDGDTWADFVGPLSRIAPVQVARLSGIDSLSGAARAILAHNPGPFVAMGHSMGGRIALELARAAPDQCAGLVLMNTGYKPLGEGEIAQREAIMAAARAGGIASMADAWLEGMIAPATRDNEALMHRMRTMVLRSTVESFCGQIQALIDRPDATALLEQLRCPVLLSSGTEDRWSPLARHEDMAALIPKATLAAIPGAGHMAPFEAPEACVAAILDWLQASFTTTA